MKERYLCEEAGRKILREHQRTTKKVALDLERFVSHLIG